MSAFKICPAFVRNPMNRLVHGLFGPVLRRLGYERKARPFSDFISFKETLTAAKSAGLSVGEYIERKHATGTRSALDQTIDGLASLGLFNGPIERICEIGPGSGRYLERINARCRPRLYEIYETSQEWRNWLMENYGVISRTCDGRTLAQTASGSVDLVHAHKVFAGLPFLTTASYFREMARIVKDGGWVVFDIMTEPCLSGKNLEAWFNENPWDWAWSPHLTPRDYTVGIFADKGILLAGSFQVPLFPAITECMAFRKASSRSTSAASDAGGSAARFPQPGHQPIP